jgi:Family of unknown function (DUF6074)
MAKIVHFPMTRRVGSIRKLARMMARYKSEAAERALAVPLRQQYEALIRRGFTQKDATREMKAFENAVRAELWGIIMRGGDAA